MDYREPFRQLLSWSARPRSWTRGLLAFVVLALSTSVPAASQQVVMVVHPATNVTSVSKAELSKIYLKRLRSWTSGEHVAPVDQIPGPLRETFSREVHGRSVITIEIFWKRMIFSGRAVPPPEAGNDEAVLEFVRSTPGAVGYVSPEATLRGVRRLTVTE